MVKNPPANAGDMGLSPGPGGSHMPRSNQARELQLLEPAGLEPVLRSKDKQATAMGSPRTTTRSGSYSPQLERARGQQRRPNNKF